MIELPQFLLSFETVNFTMLRTYPLLTGQAEPMVAPLVFGHRQDKGMSRDTTRDAEEFRTAFLRTLTGEQKVLMALEMTETTHNISRQGIAVRHPSYTPHEVQMAFVRLLLGDELFRAANPSEPLLAP